MALSLANTATDLAGKIAALTQGFSLEATRPTASDVDALAKLVAADTSVYLSAVPTKPHRDLIEAAVKVRAAGLEPVPHLAARNFASVAAFEEVVTELIHRARVRRALMIAGDHDQPAGPFRSAIEVIETGLLPSLGITEIGIAGYPDGHPRIAPEALDRALTGKVEAAAQTGLAVHIVTQFGFSPAPIIAWIRRLRALGIDHPVRIGLAGPTGIATLLRYAQRCGVKASAQGLARQAGLAKHLFGSTTPDVLVTALAQASCEYALGKVALHFFSFGGIGATARWASAASAAHITLDNSGGFSVVPPAV